MEDKELSALTRYTASDYITRVGEMVAVEDGEYVKLADVQALSATSTKPADSEIPAVLFDGKAVYDEITARLGKSHCYSADAVSTVLDAVVRLMRKSGAGTKQADDAMANVDELLYEHARAVVAAYEHGETSTYYDDLKSAEQDIRDAIANRAQLARQQAPVGDSVDTPEFRQMLWKLWDEESSAAAFDSELSHVNQIITHITAWKDAQLARERNTTLEEAAKADGVAGFGDSPSAAMWNFDANWQAKLKGAADNQEGDALGPLLAARPAALPVNQTKRE